MLSSVVCSLDSPSSTLLCRPIPCAVEPALPASSIALFAAVLPPCCGVALPCRSGSRVGVCSSFGSCLTAVESAVALSRTLPTDLAAIDAEPVAEGDAAVVAVAFSSAAGSMVNEA